MDIKYLCAQHTANAHSLQLLLLLCQMLLVQAGTGYSGPFPVPGLLSPPLPAPGKEPSTHITSLLRRPWIPSRYLRDKLLL